MRSWKADLVRKRGAGDLGDDEFIVTCEHGGNRIPASYRSLFRGHSALLATHRGYDPGALVMAGAPALRVRRNYPYAGKGDGLTSHLRRHFSPRAYVGIELEVNQKIVFAGGRPWRVLRGILIESLLVACAGRG